jgi:hypothetical protein
VGWPSDLPTLGEERWGGWPTDLPTPDGELVGWLIDLPTLGEGRLWVGVLTCLLRQRRGGGLAY